MLKGLPIVPVIGILIVRKEMIMSQKTISALSTLPISHFSSLQIARQTTTGIASDIQHACVHNFLGKYQLNRIGKISTSYLQHWQKKTMHSFKSSDGG